MHEWGTEIVQISEHWGSKSTVFVYAVFILKAHSYYYPFTQSDEFYSDAVEVQWTFNGFCFQNTQVQYHFHLHGDDHKLENIFMLSALLNWHWEELLTVTKHFTSENVSETSLSTVQVKRFFFFKEQSSEKLAT